MSAEPDPSEPISTGVQPSVKGNTFDVGLHRENNLFMARLSEASDRHVPLTQPTSRPLTSVRYDDMVHHMALIAEMGFELSVEERTLFSTAFKNAVGTVCSFMPLCYHDGC